MLLTNRQTNQSYRKVSLLCQGGNNYPLATLIGKMAYVVAQRSEGCEFESHLDQSQDLKQYKVIACALVILRACAIEIIHLTI